MNSEVEKFLKGDSKDSYNYFGAHKVNDGVCFRLYAPHAKSVEVSTNQVNHKMEKVDFRGVFETRVKDVKEFDPYHYEILTNDDNWINKNDPYALYHEIGKSAYIDSDTYIFNDDKWVSKKSVYEYFNACQITDDFKMDEQREFIEYLKKYNFNYLILKPYDEKYLYCVNKIFINESSLKNFIDNLHQFNIGVIFEFDTETFFDYPEGLNDFDGTGIYNKNIDKYKEVDAIYFDYENNATKSYVKSLLNYYLEVFHADGLYLNNSEFNKQLESDISDKIFIYKDVNASSKYIDELIENINKGFDYKKFVDMNLESNSYIVYDHKNVLKLIKGNEEYKNEISRMILALCYINNCYCISVYNTDCKYLKALEKLSNLYSSSRALYGKTKRNLLYNGKWNKYFAYEYVSKNDYILTVINFSDKEDEKFDLGMQFYGYYTLILDTKDNSASDELFYTREKKIHNKELALKMHLKPNQVLVYKRMRDI